jgi:hypothetical protein
MQFWFINYTFSKTGKLYPHDCEKAGAENQRRIPLGHGAVKSILLTGFQISLEASIKSTPL